MKWYEQLNAAGVAEIARVTGYKELKGETFQCPACKKLHRGSQDKRGAVGTTSNKKGWLCHRCGATGSLLDWVSFHIGGSKYKELQQGSRTSVREWSLSNGYGTRDNQQRKPVQGSVSSVLGIKETKAKTNTVQHDGGAFGWRQDAAMEYRDNLWNQPQGSRVRNYLLNNRKLDQQVCEAADLGSMKAQGMDWLVIPLKNPDGDIVNMRFRSLPPEGEKKSYRVCKGRPMPLYGGDELTKGFDDMVILCEGELDVLAMKTLGYTHNVVSTTTGAGSFAEEWLDALEPFSSFWLFYDNDNAGNEGADLIAQKLGKYRCMRMKTKYNDVGEVLQLNADPSEIDKAFDDARPYIDSKLLTVGDYADELERLILQPDTMKGISTGSDRLDACCGGMQAGLWVVTGDTGHGKTSWATWLLWEMARGGTPIMLTSFEQSPIGTVQKLLRNQLGGDFTEVSIDERRRAINQLNKLPIRILDHYGNTDMESVIESIRFSARRYGTKIVLIDHLHFLVKPSGDERQELENIVRTFALLAKNDDITIVLICHPNNMAVSQQRRVKITDLKGASAIRQDAHVALVVERGKPTPNRPYPHSLIYFDKVRSEFGQAGSRCVLAYDPIACVYADQWEYTPAGRAGIKVIAQ